MYISPCSDRCRETMTSDRTCFIHEGYITMYASYFRDILQFSDCCQETVTTEGSCFIPKGTLTCLALSMSTVVSLFTKERR